MLSLEDFKAIMKDTARPNRFLCTVYLPSAIQATFMEAYDLQFLCRSSKIPGRDVGQVEHKTLGMSYKFAGDPLYDDLTLTFINDYDWRARDLFERWMDFIHNPETNVRADVRSYVNEGKINVQQFGRDKDEVLASYDFIAAYPKQMTEIDLSYDSNDTIAEFSVTFSYSYWKRN